MGGWEGQREEGRREGRKEGSIVLQRPGRLSSGADPTSQSLALLTPTATPGQKSVWLPD